VAPTPPPIATTEQKPAQHADKPKPAKSGRSATKAAAVVDDKPAETPAPKQPVEAKKGDKEADPSFDELLKEAGVDKTKKEAKPKLEKKSLSGDDFKSGMASVAAKAQGCYKGTQGTASIKLTISPSGQVAKVSVGGLFANKPEATCVAGAVKAASFPPWDGGPQTFNYSYLLSE
jgi:hypothetical protein